MGLSSDRVVLTVDPGFGARVTSLIDRATGRDWLVQGGARGDVSDAAAYLGAQARGWDECLPTVAPCDVPGWGALRDHGAMWGRPWMADRTETSITTTYIDGEMMFARKLTLSDATLTCGYALTTLKTLPWMWSQHCLLEAQPDERIVLDGFCNLTVAGTSVGWPRHAGRDLSATAPDGSATKVYALATGPVTAALTGPHGGIRFAWDGAEIPALGLWLDRGGWPDDDPITQFAIEPTTAPADDLATAVTQGTARTLTPRETARWTVTITLTDTP